MKTDVLDKGYLDVVEVWGADEQIIEAARMSTNKGFQGWGHPAEPGDERLLAYLWKHKHHSPFEMAGLTVEVNNTDAEGRLILGDGLWYARQRGATHLIDVATLTGAIVVALGKITTGLFGTPQPWVDHIRVAADRAGEKLWQLPLFDDYKTQLKSDIADMLNSPGRPAGSVTAEIGRAHV